MNETEGAPDNAEETSAEQETPVHDDAETDAPAADVPPVEDPTSPEAIRRRLKGLPGRWYVLHTYAGYEKRVKQNLEIRMKSMNMEDYIFQVEVPMEEVFEVKRGERKLVNRVRMPGYALVRMDMEDEAWRTVQETQGVTGFVGNGRDPVALTEPEVIKMLTPVVELEVAKELRSQGRPARPGTEPAVVSVEFEVGENVILTLEPWVGMPATIDAVDAAQQRLTVLMTLVGQETPVDLSFSQVKKAD
ncbi:transcription termination/antitermination factor NusG [Flaviflexus sp. JY899]|uniref:Transcription termination/antitermination protein NusG n=2 Tax=Flaviflexus equikiangi TaxID=2758573 RepID=A0ABS2THI1_9ACTO|nr:transcription termination/antitermination protein NusG [Flaviflexus equikiangi]MBM9433818.1 transcription termination/antitermination factor NusG [Flaviflexus equikiangi]